MIRSLLFGVPAAEDILDVSRQLQPLVTPDGLGIDPTSDSPGYL